MHTQALILALSAAAGLSTALQPLEVRGPYFVNPSTGKRFQIIGVAYQPGGSSGYKPELGHDPLSDKEACLRDAALMQQLGVNAIRVYNVNPGLNHDECASIFNAAGMYMILDVNSPLAGESLASDNPAGSYHAAYLNRTFAVVEAFRHYPNTLAFFSANEVINNLDTGKTTPPYLRAVTRDIKKYIAQHSDRPIPVGYSAAQVQEVLFDSWRYLTCRLPEGGDAGSGADSDSDDMSRADLFALNSYSWCGSDATFESAGYDNLVAGFRGSAVPIFFSEYGCNIPVPRAFTEVGALYSTRMTGLLSGGVVYEFAQEPNDYGLVELDAVTGTAQTRPDFDTLRRQLNRLDRAELRNLSATPAGGAEPAPVPCSPSLVNADYFATSFDIPPPPPGVDDIINKGVEPRPAGKIVPLGDDLTVSVAVKDTRGREMTLELRPVPDDSTGNLPGRPDGAASDADEGSDGLRSGAGQENATGGVGALRPGVVVALVVGVVSMVGYL